MSCRLFCMFPVSPPALISALPSLSRSTLPSESSSRTLWNPSVTIAGQPPFESTNGGVGDATLLPGSETREWPPPPPQRIRPFWKLWRRDCRASWADRLASWHLWALQSRDIKFWCLRTNLVALLLQPITVFLLWTAPDDFSFRITGNKSVFLSRLYLADFAISTFVLLTELLYWCFLYLPILREAAEDAGDVLMMSPLATLLTEVVASLDFWILVFAFVELLKHGLSLTIAETQSSLMTTVRHTIICGAFFIIFLKYYGRGKRDLESMTEPRPFAQNLSGPSFNSVRRDEHEDYTGYWDYYAGQS